jgi:DNA-binding transcriptional MocR family regulator
VTTGAHQAISLVARQVLEPGATVLVESPTYPGALDVFRRFGARVVPVPVDREGMRGNLVAELAQRSGASALFVTPHFHNPTGTVLSLERRIAIAEAAERVGLVVIEDQAMADLDLDGGPLPPPIASLAPDHVHVIGSTSKLLWAGLRIGWLRSPEAWTARMLATKTVADLGTPLISQLVATRLLDDLDRVRAERAADLAPRRDLLLRLIAERLPGWTATRPRGGLSVWAELPSGNSVEFAELAARFGVSFVPGPALSVDEGNRRALRLVHARSEDDLVEGVDRLAAAWSAYAPDAARSTARLLV